MTPPCGVGAAMTPRDRGQARVEPQKTAANELLSLIPKYATGEVMRGTFGRANLGFALFTLIASGCVTLQPYDPGPGRRIAVSVAQDTYVSGESVNVTIANLSDVELTFPAGFCKTQLQRMDGTVWTTIPSSSAGCPVRLGFLDPQQ